MNPQLPLCETQPTHEPPESNFQERGQQERRTNLLPQVAAPNQETPPSQASHRRGSERRRSGDKAGGTYSTAAPPPPPGNPTLNNLGPKLQPTIGGEGDRRRRRRQLDRLFSPLPTAAGETSRGEEKMVAAACHLFDCIAWKNLEQVDETVSDVVLV